MFTTSTLHAQSELLSVEPRHVLGPLGGAVRALAFSFDGSQAVLGASSGRVVLLDLAKGTTRASWELSGAVTAAGFSRNDSIVALGTARGEIVLLEPGTGRLRALAKGSPATSLAMNATGRTLAVGTSDGRITLWSVETGMSIGHLRDGHRGVVRHVAFLDGETASLLSVGADRQLVYWDVKQLRRTRQTTDVDTELLSAASDPTGKLLVVGTENFRRGSFSQPNSYLDFVRIYDTQAAAPQKVLDMQGRSPVALAVSPDFRYVATGLKDARGSTIAIWDVERGVSVVDLPVDGGITALGFAPNGSHLVGSTDKGTAMTYALAGITPRVTAVADLRGVKYRITSPRQPLIRPTRRVRFAVMGFEDNGVGADVARAIADQVDNRLAANDGVRLVERRRIDAILKEQDLQHSGRTDAGTAVQLARVLNVNKAVLGSVAKLGTTLTIAVRLVDAETAAIDGVREVQCQACSLEDLSFAVAELAQTLVGQPDANATPLPEPPTIRVDYPRGDMETAQGALVVRGQITYTRTLEGVELIVNGRAIDASRLLNARDGKVTRMADGTTAFTFVQEVLLERGANVIALRAIGSDGNDDQRYLTVRRTGQTTTDSSPPGIALAELESALANKVPSRRIVTLIESYGIDFDPDEPTTARLRTTGADAAVLAACAKARRVRA